jgi:hypothetical protein
MVLAQNSYSKLIACTNELADALHKKIKGSSTSPSILTNINSHIYYIQENLIFKHNKHTY